LDVKKPFYKKGELEVNYVFLIYNDQYLFFCMDRTKKGHEINKGRDSFLIPSQETLAI